MSCLAIHESLASTMERKLTTSCKSVVLGLFGVILSLSSAIAGTDANVCVQGELKELGYYAGEVNGKIDGATKSAGLAYFNYMKSENDPQNTGQWNIPALTTQTAEHWCKSLFGGSEKMAKYLMAFNGPGTALLRINDTHVEGATNTREPYSVVVGFQNFGKDPFVVTGICFNWNGASDMCFDIPGGTTRSPVVVALTTGRAGDYGINARLKYKTGGKTLVTGENTVFVKVTE